MRDMTLKGESLSDRARKNLSILDTIRRSGPISKTEISSFIGVNVVTVSNYVEEFLRQKLIFEKELDVSKGGRRPVLLDLNPEAGYAVGIGLNLLHGVAVLVDMRGKILSHVAIKKNHPQQSAKEVVDILLKLARDLLAQAPQLRDKIKGIGIGIAGIVDSRRETVRWPENDGTTCRYSLIALPLRDAFQKEFNLPVKIDNDATLACFGEQWLSQEADVKDVLFMFSGVGCGIMVNGEVYRGATGCAGELSIYNSKLDESGDSCCQAAQVALLKRHDIDLGIVHDIKTALPSRIQSMLWKLCGGSLEKINLEMVVQALEADDALAGEVIKKTARELGTKIAFLVNLLNPQMVIIGGGLEQLGQAFLDEIRHTVAQWAFEEAGSVVKIVPSRLGENAVALGAANLVVRDIFVTVKD